VKDDGIIRSEIETFLNWDGFEPASADKIVSFYRKYKEPLGMFPGYRPKYLVKPTTSKRLEAIQLSNGIYIPATPSATDRDLGLEDLSPQQIEWAINKTIMTFTDNRKSTEALQRLRQTNNLKRHLNTSVCHL
jgi:hypothetical protein